MSGRPLEFVVVGRIGRPHGVRGEVSVEVRTDDPGLRFVPGAVLSTDPEDAGPLRVRCVRQHKGHPLIGFDGVPDRTAAETLRGTLLLAEPIVDADPDTFYDHDLVGLRVRLTDGRQVGTVAGVEHGPGQDLLVIDQTSLHTAAADRLARIPFVRALVPQVDLGAGTVTVDPPGGLLAAVPAAGDQQAPSPSAGPP